MNFEYKIDHNSKNKNRKIDYSFVSAHSTSSNKMGPFLRGGDLHILNWEKPQVFNGHFSPYFRGGGEILVIVNSDSPVSNYTQRVWGSSSRKVMSKTQF